LVAALETGRDEQIVAPHPLSLPSAHVIGSYALLACLLLPIVIPLLWLLGSWVEFDPLIWAHFYDTQLARLVSNTLFLLVGVGILATLLGVLSAWCVVRYEFPFKRPLEWLLVLPLAVPAYVLAFVMEGWLGVGGVWYQFCAPWFGRACEVSSGFKAILTLSLVLYPYVYLLARVAFLQQSPRILAVSRTLGLSARAVFWRVGLPLARPAIIAGLALALMEAAADFGAVSVFNYDTFTTAVYKMWFGLFNLPAATQLASVLMSAMFLLVIIERMSRRRLRYESDNSRTAAVKTLRSWLRWAVSLFLCLLTLLAFVGPVVQLVIWASQVYDQGTVRRLFVLLEHTAALASLAALIILPGAVVLLAIQRSLAGRLNHFWLEMANLGYAIPGTVLAVAIMLSLNSVDAWMASTGWFKGQTWWVGGIAGLLVAYWVRFLSVMVRPTAASLVTIKPSLGEAARTLGASEFSVWWRVYLPLALPGIFTGLLAAFVEVAKEMPVTLLLRPFGWDTLAVNIYELTSEGEWHRAAWPGLTLVLLGLIPVYLLIRRSRGREPTPVARRDAFGRSEENAFV
jgi:iron(III) transport system permease protein